MMTEVAPLEIIDIDVDDSNDDNNERKHSERHIGTVVCSGDNMPNFTLEKTWPVRNSTTSANWAKLASLAQTISTFNKVSDDVKEAGVPAVTSTEKEETSSEHSSESKQSTVEIIPEALFDWEALYVENVYKPWWIINPTSKWLAMWDMFIFIWLLYVAIVFPVRAGLLLDSTGGWLGVEILIDMIFLTDMVVIFNTAIYDGPEESHLNVSNRAIAINYLKTWFLIDIAALFPTYFFSSSEDGDDVSSLNKISRLARVPRVLKLLRFLRVLKVLRAVRSGRLQSSVNGFLLLPASVRRFLRFILFMLLLQHIMSCVWMFLATLESYSYPAWSEKYGVEFGDHVTLYIVSSYWAFQTITTVGYGDVPPRTNSERVVAIICMILGVTFYSFTISNMSSIMATMDNEKNQHNKKMAYLHEFIQESKLPKDLALRIRKHFEKRSTLHSVPNSMRVELLEQMPSTIRVEVAFFTHHYLISKVPFLRDNDPNFVASIVPELKSIYFECGESILQQGDHLGELFFIERGRVEVRMMGNSISRILPEGSYFGDQALLSYRHQASLEAMATTSCKIIYLTRDSLFAALKKYPMVFKSMKNAARKRSQFFQDEHRVRSMAGSLNHDHSEQDLTDAISITRSITNMNTGYSTYDMTEEDRHRNSSQSHDVYRELERNRKESAATAKELSELVTAVLTIGKRLGDIENSIKTLRK